jgi:hypothetical protein
MTTKTGDFGLLRCKVGVTAILPIRAKALKLLEGVRYTQYDDEKGPLKIYRGQQYVVH